MKYRSKVLDINNDPVSVFENVVKSSKYCFLLETLADKYQPMTSKQSYIGCNPINLYSCKDNSFSINNNKQTAIDSYQHLRKQFNEQGNERGGYVGGLVGYFSHESIQQFEPTIKFNYPREYDDFEFAEYDDGIIFNPNTKPEYFFYKGDKSSGYLNGIQNTSKDLQIRYKSADKDVTQYMEMIKDAKKAITNGRVFQVVLANKYEYEFEGELFELYKELRQVNPSPFMFYLKFDKTITFGASPELLVNTSMNNQMYLEALAGTIKRGNTADEDSEFAQKLLDDEKEIAEHSMLVDLARNDVGRICKIGSVKVDKLMYIKKLSHVQHISSIVSGKMLDQYDAFDALRASFPAGTLSGAPKIEAIKMIGELEGSERGPYGGTVGYFSYNGTSEHAVNIRSVSAKGNMLTLHSGSGIVYDSVALHELREINAKKAAMEKAMGRFTERNTYERIAY